MNVGSFQGQPNHNAADQLHTIYTHQRFDVELWHFEIPIQEHGCCGSSLMN